MCDLSARSCHKQIEPNKGPQQVAPTRLRSNPLSGSSNGKETVPMSVRVSSPDDVQFPIIENSSIQYEYSKFKQDSDANETTLLTGQITVANEGVSEISNNNFNADASETDAIIVAIILEIPFSKLFETKFRLKKITKIYTTSSFVAAMFK